MIEFTLLYKCKACGQIYRLESSMEMHYTKVDFHLVTVILRDAGSTGFHMCKSDVAFLAGVSELIGVENIRSDSFDS